MNYITKSWRVLRMELTIFQMWIAALPFRLVALVALAVLAALALAAKPAYQAFRVYRIDRILSAAKAAEQRADWGTARDLSRSVLLTHQNDFEAYRIWTRALGKTGEPRAYMAAAQLFTDPRATREDRLDALQVMALHAPQAIVLGAYDRLPKNLRDQAAFRAVIIPLLIQRGECKLAEQGLREVTTTTDAPAVRLELLRALCSHPNPQRVAEARRIFADLIITRANTEALAALLILGDTTGGLAPGAPLPDLTEWLGCQPQAAAIHHLLGMNPALLARPEIADRFYQAAVTRFLTSDPGVLGDWLLSHAQAGQAAAILEQPAQSRPDAYLARLHALLCLHQQSAIKTALAAPPAAVDLVEIEIVRAHFAAMCGDPMAASAAWTRALNQATYDTNRNRFIDIARAAAAAGANDAAEDAWVAAIRSGWGRVPLYGDLLPVFASLLTKGRSEDLLAMFRALLAYEPTNPELLHNFYYFALIHGLLPPYQVATAMTRLIQQVDQPVYHSTLMLAEMLDDRPADALARLAEFRDRPCVTPMMQTALEGSARTLAGETATGTALLKEVDWSLFMRQERVVFRNLLVKPRIAGIPLPELKIEPMEPHPDQVPAWRKAIERLEKERATDVLPALQYPNA